jgi:hypothetical protein
MTGLLPRGTLVRLTGMRTCKAWAYSRLRSDLSVVLVDHGDDRIAVAPLGGYADARWPRGRYICVSRRLLTVVDPKDVLRDHGCPE